MSKVTVNIPFHGFYETIHDSQIQGAVYDEVAYQLFEESFDLLDDEQSEKVTDWVWDNIHKEEWDKIKLDYCKKFIEAFGQEYDLNSIELESLTSPREYNFETDRIFANVELSELRDLLDNVSYAGFSDWLYERMMPRDGFIPFYSNNFSEWGHSSNWDANQWGLILEFYTQDDDFDYKLDFPVNELENICNISVD
jgi:hypothetical protein